MDTIKDLVKEFKARNGGEISFTTKEIVVAIWQKLDKHESRITRTEAMTTLLTILFTGLCIKAFIFS